MEIGDTVFIGAIDTNNGMSHKISSDPIFKPNSLTVNYDGNGVGLSYFQPEPFWALDSVNVLENDKINAFVGMFISTLIKQDRYRFNYGRKWHKERMENSMIKLPITDQGRPDWQFMEDYIKSLPYSSNLENMND